MSNKAFSDLQEGETRREYDRLLPFYRRLAEEACFILRDEISRQKIKIHGDVFYRIKTFNSLAKKIERRQQKQTSDSTGEIEDLAGVRIICLYRSDLERLGKLISECFQVLTTSTSRTRDETHFGYMADHYIVKLRQESKGKRYDEIKSLKCEIQVRTILMDAWDSVSHHLVYKREADIPTELRKDFNAVSGLLYAADTHFELFKNAIEKCRKELAKAIDSNKFNCEQEINLDSLEAYLKWKMPDRERFVDMYSIFVSELLEFGYRRIVDIDNVVGKSMTAAEALEAAEMGKKFYNDTGLLRLCLLLSDESYRVAIQKRFPKGNERLFQLVEEYRNRTRSA